MARITEQTRARNEIAIRAAMDRLLRGEIPDGGRCDLTTLAAQAGVTRTAFYPKKNPDGTSRPGPYQHLAEEFTRRLAVLHQAGELPDSRDAQITRLKDANAALRQRLQDKDRELDELATFKQLALSRIAAQHAEIERLRARSTPPALTVLRPMAGTPQA